METPNRSHFSSTVKNSEISVWSMSSVTHFPSSMSLFDKRNYRLNNCKNGLESCLFLRFNSKAFASLGLPCLIHCDSLPENVRLTSAPFSNFASGSRRCRDCRLHLPTLCGTAFDLYLHRRMPWKFMSSLFPWKRAAPCSSSLWITEEGNFPGVSG